MSTDIDRMTYHEKNATFDLLKKDRTILSNHNLENFEKELIIALTEIEPQKRPSASEIKNIWLPKWQEQLIIPLD